MSPAGQTGAIDFSDCSGFAHVGRAGAKSALGAEDRIDQPWKPSVEVGPAQAIDHLRPFLAALDQPSAPEDVEMVGHCCTRQLVGRRAVAGKAFAHLSKIVAKTPDNGEARRVRQCMKHARQRHVVEIGVNEPGHIADIEQFSKISNIPLFGYIEL